MANGLLGKLTIDTSAVTKAIAELNINLQSIGKGLNIDMSGVTNPIKDAMNAINSEVDKVNQHMSTLGSKGVGGNANTKKQLSELKSLFVDLERVQQRMITGSGANDMSELSAQYDMLKSRIAEYSQEMQKAASESTQVQRAQARTAQIIAQAWDKIEEKQRATSAAEEERYQKQASMAARRADELGRTYRQADLQHTFDTELSPEQQKIQKLVDLYTQLEQVKQKMYAGEGDPGELQQKYEELTQTIGRYTEAHRNEAEQDTRVVAAREETLKLVEKLSAQEEAATKKREQEKARAEQAAQKEEERIQKQVELAEKKSQALARAQRESEIRETFAEEDAKIKELVSQYTELERIKQRQAALSKDSHEYQALEKQAQAIQANINNAEKYTDAQRKAAQESEKVTEAIKKTELAQAKAADQADKNAQKVSEQAKQQAQNITNLTNRMISMFSTMVLMRGMRELWSNATSYAKDYYDQMNEIQVVTMKSNDQISTLSTQYRQMAKEMSVSSKDIASAATTFYRQGLGDAEVEQRLKYTTQYAKVAAMDFNTAADLITATANSMGDQIQGNIQRVTDVFIYLGDNAGTSAQEVGTAMQKAAASAGQFGMSFEWLGSYIATVSETTRQAAEVVGTSFNAIIARLHTIRTTGFNQEDETKINDVAKALGTLDIALLDNEGNWRDMTDIFNDVASKWDTLDGKQKSYIATTMAGTRQQNTFLALMNDLSKGVEGGSRAWELYEGAMNSAGTTMEKYEIWSQSVEASQGRLNAALEEMYNLFVNGDMLKGVTDFGTSLVESFTAATKASGGLNILIPTIAGIGIAMKHAGGALTVFKSAFDAIMAHKAMLTITGIAIAVGLLSKAFGDMILARQRAYDSAMEEVNKAQTQLESLQNTKVRVNDMFDGLQSGNKTLSDYTGLLNTISEISPTAAQAVQGLKDGVLTQAEAFAVINQELDTMIEKYQKVSELGFLKAMDNYQLPEGLRGAVSELEEINEYLSIIGEKTPLGNMSENARNLRIGELLLSDDFGSMYGSKTLDYYNEKYGSAKDQIYELLEMYNNSMDEAMNSEEGRRLAGRIWDILTGSNEETQANAKAEFDKQFQMMTEILDGEMSDLQVKSMRDVLWNELAGEDGIMSSDDIGKLGTLFGDTLRTIFREGIENTQFGSFATFAREYLSQGVIDAFSSTQREDIADMIAKGVDPIDLSRMLDSLFDLDGLENADLLMEYTDRLKQGIADALNWEDIGDWKWMADAGVGELQQVFDTIRYSGADIEDLYNAMQNSTSFESFIENLKNLGVATSDLPKTEEELAGLTDTMDKFSKATESAAGNIDKIKKVRDALAGGDGVSVKDMNEVLELYPQLLNMLGDSEKVSKGLGDALQEQSRSMIKTAQEYILNSQEIAKYSPFASLLGSEGMTLADYKKVVGETSSEASKVDRYVTQAIVSYMAATNQLANVPKEILTEWQSTLFSESNVDLLARPLVDAAKLAEAGWKDAGDGIATVFSNTYEATTSGKDKTAKWVQDANLIMTPISKDGQTVYSPEELDEYAAKLFEISQSIDELYANDDLGLVISVDTESAQNDLLSLEEILHRVQEQLYNLGGDGNGSKTKLQELGEKAATGIVDNLAKTTEYIDYIGQLESAFAEGGVEKAAEAFNGMNSEIQSGLSSEYPQLIAALNQANEAMQDTTKSTKDVTNATDKFSGELKDARRYLDTKYYDKTAKSIKEMKKGTKDAADAYKDYIDESKAAAKATAEFNENQKKVQKGAQLAESDVEKMASVLNMSAKDIIANWDEMPQIMADLQAEGDSMYESFNRTALMTILGTSSADFSNIMSGLVAVQGSAASAVAALQSIGNFEVVDKELTEGMTYYTLEGTAGHQYLVAHTATETANMQMLVPKGSSDSSSSGPSSSGGGGGGGGGGGKEKKGPTEVERVLDRMDQRNDIRSHQQDIYSAYADLYEGRGELQNVIAYHEKERAAIMAENLELQKDLLTIEKYMKQKEQEIASLSTEDEKYAEVHDDLEALQERHQEYTKDLIDNRKKVDELTKAIKEQQDAIRDMEIELRETVLSAIEDREEKRRNMLENEIEMEDIILDLIKQRYEKERDMTLDLADERIEALEKERDLLKEQLDARKEQAEAEDKQAKLLELEAKLARIAADPTRRKEMLQLEKEANELREEISWDAAEKEVEDRQKAIDEQITSIEDYKEYVENYYEEMFKYPTQLIAEMKEIITGTDEEIIEWLKANSEDFAAATENTQQKMVDDWQTTLDEMHGRYKLYWDEVEEIISKGDNYIIQFLKDNSEEYAKAGKLQAEKYVDEWKKQLDDLHKAYKAATTPEDARDYQVLELAGANGNGGNGGGSGGGGGTGGNENKKEDKKELNSYWMDIGSSHQKVHKWSDGSITYSDVSPHNWNHATGKCTVCGRYEASKKTITTPTKDGRGAGYNNENRIAQFGTGGLVTKPTQAIIGETGRPERVLSPDQTMLFDTMVATMQNIARVGISAMPEIGSFTGGGGNSLAVDQIIVNVETLADDADYDEMADKIFETLVERVQRGSAVGGFFSNS